MTGRGQGIELYTIGHSNMPVDEFLVLLRANEIQTLVDVRSSPYSQYTSQFDRENLHLKLEDVGMEYIFAGGALGGRPKDPTCYKSGRVPDGKANYLELVDYGEVAKRPWYQDGIGQLLDLASVNRVAVMCSEEDPSDCHRQHLITKTLLQCGVSVWHIRRNGPNELGREQPEQLTLF